MFLNLNILTFFHSCIHSFIACILFCHVLIKTNALNEVFKMKDASLSSETVSSSTCRVFPMLVYRLTAEAFISALYFFPCVCYGMFFILPSIYPLPSAGLHHAWFQTGEDVDIM